MSPGGHGMNIKTHAAFIKFIPFYEMNTRFHKDMHRNANLTNL